jgi:TRAP-type C4-dicarboxylate transport system permease large subunit
MVVETLFAAIYVIAAAVSLWSRSQVVGFVEATPSIRSSADLERFKDLARLEMYLALAMIVLLVTGLVIGLVLIREHGVVALLPVLFVNAVVLGLGVYHKGVEERARSLPAADVLNTEYRRVCYAWNKKALPDF